MPRANFQVTSSDSTSKHATAAAPEAASVDVPGESGQTNNAISMVSAPSHSQPVGPLLLFDEHAVRLHYRLLSNEPTVIVWIGTESDGQKQAKTLLAWSEDEFVDLCRRGVSGRRDVYAMVQRGPQRRRDSIQAISTIFLDIDPCGAIKDAPDRWQDGVSATTGAAYALARALHAAGLTPYPVSACSGNGAYVFIPVSPIAPPGGYQEALKAFAEWCDARISDHSLVRLDKACTPDLVRIARVIGTPNLKSPTPRPTYWLSEAGVDPHGAQILRYESNGLAQYMLQLELTSRPAAAPAHPGRTAGVPSDGRSLIEAVRAEAGLRLADLFASFGYEGHEQAPRTTHDQRIAGRGGLIINTELGLWNWFVRGIGGDAIDAFGFLAAERDGVEWDKSAFRRGPAFIEAVRELSDWLRARGVNIPDERVLRPLTDLGNAERLIDHHGDDLRYCSDRAEWFIWEGTRWHADAMEVRRRAIESARGIASDIQLVTEGNAEDGKARKNILAHARKSEAKDRLSAATDVAQACLLPDGARVAIRHAQFDADPYTLNCANGILNLKSGELRPHSRDAMLTKQVCAPFIPGAQSDVWERFLYDVTGGDVEFIAYLQKAAGYALTGSTSEERFFVIHGPTRSGKTTFIEAIKTTLGDYAATSSFDTWVQRTHSGGPRGDIARLASVRLVTASEVNREARLDEAVVKQFTGGDTITARPLYRGEFEFRPQAKLFLIANERPRISGNPSDAIWSRLVEIPFPATIPEDKRDTSVKARLTDPTTSGAAILAWAVAGAQAWLREGLGTVPAVVTAATNDYRSEVDTLGAFIEDCCTVDTAARAHLAEIHQAWLGWAARTGECLKMTDRALGKELHLRGFERGRDNKGRILCGLALRR